MANSADNKSFHFPVFDRSQLNLAQLQQPVIQYELMSRYRVIPIHHDQETLHLGLADPTDHAAITAIQFHTGLRIKPILVSETELDELIQQYCQPHILYAQLESTLSKMTPVEEPPAHQESAEQSDEPVIQFVNHLIHDAYKKNVSDIHLEPQKSYYRIRFRRDGLLYEAATLPLHLAMRVITRLKLMAHINIAERRLPQDGRFHVNFQQKIDIRVNACPTVFGEKMVLRLLNYQHTHMDIHALGMNDEQKRLFLHALAQPQGLILVTGPTGSGKTITLYAALQQLNRIEKNISSVEDPVEIELPGINQINIHPRIGLDFPAVLRTFLRQDPDVIMVGEIRDAETALMATQAAQTGHLVLSTLHTNHAIQTLSRLQSMGIAAYHLANSLSLIIAQRLVRVLCPHCKKPDTLPPKWQTQYSGRTIYQAMGCQHCHQGYHGRTGIFECLAMTDHLAQQLLSGIALPTLLHQAKPAGWLTLWDAGMTHVCDGTTSYAELLRVIGDISDDLT